MTASNFVENFWLVPQTCRVCEKAKPRIDFARSVRLTCSECQREIVRKKNKVMNETQTCKHKRRWSNGDYGI